SLGRGVPVVLYTQEDASLLCLSDAFQYFDQCCLASAVLECIAYDVSVSYHAFTLNEMRDRPGDCLTRRLDGEPMCGCLLDQPTEIDSLLCSPLFPILVQLVPFNRSFAGTR